MDKVAYKANDQDVVGFWLSCGIPNGSTEEDFEEYAEDPETFEEFVEVFKKYMKLVHKNDGLVNATDEELELARKYEPEIENAIIDFNW